MWIAIIAGGLIKALPIRTNADVSKTPFIL